MTTSSTTRKLLSTCAFALACGGLSLCAQAPPKLQAGEGVSNTKPAILDQVGIEQRLNQQVPLDLMFVDETGQPVELRQYFGSKPVILALVYFQCPRLCSEDE